MATLRDKEPALRLPADWGQRRGMVNVHSDPSTTYALLSEGGCCGSMAAVHETSPAGPPKPRLLDRVRQAVRARHYSRRTEKTYVAWVRGYILFHDKRHPAEMGAAEVTPFLTSLAVDGNVAASTQNQALSALLFLYRDVLGQALPWLDSVVRAKGAQRSAGIVQARPWHHDGTMPCNHKQRWTFSGGI
jgi:hypothetical protein